MFRRRTTGKLALCFLLITTTIGNVNSNEAKSYHIPNLRANWFKAVEFCNSIGMDLVSIKTREDNEAVANFVKGTDKFNDVASVFWIGASDLSEEGTFTWISSGQLVTFSNWSPGEPNNVNQTEDCMQLVYIPKFQQRWTWNDNNCKSWNAYFICESATQGCVQPFK